MFLFCVQLASHYQWQKKKKKLDKQTRNELKPQCLGTGNKGKEQLAVSASQNEQVYGALFHSIPVPKRRAADAVV